MGRWKTLSSEEVYQTPWIRVRRDEVLTHRNKPLTYSVVELQHPTVTIVATNEKDEILLQRNYRYTIDKTVWELPSGHSDGEDPLMAAKRELQEETGLASNRWTLLGRIYEVVGIGKVPANIFLAQDVHDTSGERDEDEAISDHQFMGLEAIEALARAGELTNGSVLQGVYLYMAYMKGGTT